MDASISFTESDQLEAAEKIFSEEEFDAMIAEVIEEMSTNRSNELSIEWRPDFEQIQAAGDQLAKKKKRQLWWRCAAAAVLFLLLPAVSVRLKLRNTGIIGLKSIWNVLVCPLVRKYRCLNLQVQ